MSLHLWAVALVAVERVAELVYGERNRRRLMAQGAVEVGARHYPWMVAIHAAWLVAIAVGVPADAPVYWPLLALYGVVLVLRVWVMVSLGRFWTSRVITLPGAPLVRRGPYRFLRHPNYVVVVLEIAILPLAFGAWEIALVFSVLNLIALAHRIRVEDAALAERRTG